MPGGALAETQGEAAPRDEGARGARAVTTGPNGERVGLGERPAVALGRLEGAAAGASVSRMVLSPTVQRPRRANPSAAARSIAARAAPSRVGASSARAPASRKAVP